MTEIVPGIHRLKIPLPGKDVVLGYVNVYLIEGKNGHLLVDTGWNTDEAFDSLEKQLSEIGVRFQDISQIAITHTHPDHYGLAGKLQQLCGARVILHQIASGLIDSRCAHMDALLEQVAEWLKINGVPSDILVELQTASSGMANYVTPATPDFTLYGDETIACGASKYRSIWTAGHSPDHICLYEPDRKILISGDHILPTITPNIGLHPQSTDNPLGDFFDSLNTVKSLDVSLVLPGHENPFNNLQLRIDEIFQHHNRRNQEILATMRTGSKTAFQIANEITWLSDTNGVGWQKLSPLDKRLAVLETAAHLEFMRFDGKTDKLVEDDVTHYQSL